MKITSVIADAWAIAEYSDFVVHTIRINPADLPLFSSSTEFKDGRIWTASILEESGVHANTFVIVGSISAVRLSADYVSTHSIPSDVERDFTAESSWERLNKGIGL